MTGEMLFITQDGTDQDGDVWHIHAEVAKAVGGKLKPFDKYQGPYISIGPDLRVGNNPYAIPVRLRGGGGFVRLWLTTDDDYFGRVYREDTDTLSEPFPMEDMEMAIEAAKSLLERKRNDYNLLG